MRMTMGWTKTQTWATVCVHLTKKTVKGQRHELTTEKRDYENERSSIHEDTCIGVNYAHMFSKSVRSLHTLLGFALYFVSSIQLMTLHQFIQFLTCTRIPCRDSHCENGSFEVFSAHHPVSCSRPPSAVNDPIATKLRTLNKIVKVDTSEVLWKDGKQKISPFYHVALHASSFIDILWIIMNSIRNHSIATNWRKNSMIGAIADTSRMAWAWVVVLQILGVDGLMWTTLRWSQNDSPWSSVSRLIERDPPILFVSKIFCCVIR